MSESRSFVQIVRALLQSPGHEPVLVADGVRGHGTRFRQFVTFQCGPGASTGQLRLSEGTIQELLALPEGKSQPLSPEAAQELFELRGRIARSPGMEEVARHLCSDEEAERLEARVAVTA